MHVFRNSTEIVVIIKRYSFDLTLMLISNHLMYFSSRLCLMCDEDSALELEFFIRVSG